MSKKLIGSEITQDILTRLAHLESLVLCQWCEDGVYHHQTLGEVRCPQCEGTGNRIDALERRHD